MAIASTKRFFELGDELVLAPERYDPRRASLSNARGGEACMSLGSFVQNWRGLVTPGRATAGALKYLVLDTSDVREGFVVCRKEALAPDKLGSVKKSVEAGDVIISRLRPYLRQVALVDKRIPGWEPKVQLMCSTEFFVLRPKEGESIAFLVPYLLSEPVQRVLAAAQEGGHHPRFDDSVLMTLPVPETLALQRDSTSATIERGVSLFRDAEDGVRVSVQTASAALNGRGARNSHVEFEKRPARTGAPRR